MRAGVRIGRVNVRIMTGRDSVRIITGRVSVRTQKYKYRNRLGSQWGIALKDM